MSKNLLSIRGLHASVAGKEILRGIDLSVAAGEVHAIMGPNGSGKSTLSLAVMGHPNYSVSKGGVSLDGQSILGLPADERCRRGLFLSFQHPVEIAGVTLSDFLRTAYNNSRPQPERLSPFAFAGVLEQKMDLLGLPKSFAGRYVNEGFSGGEKKRCEILQMALLKPKVAFLDEIDSGLDVDALSQVASAAKAVASECNAGLVVITHYPRILNYIRPDFVHVLVDGRIAESGGFALAKRIESEGYSRYGRIKLSASGGV